MARSKVTEPLEGPTGPHKRIRTFRLRVLGSKAAPPFCSSGERVGIGTHKSNDWVLNDPTLSRFHCELVLQEGVPVLRDLGSRNGTWVDGVRIHQAPLRERAIITMGRTRVRFEISHEDARVALSEEEQFGRLVGRSEAMRAAFAQLQRAARSDSTVLLAGETGVGKDLAAEAIHAHSVRRNGPFVVVDCGALPAPMVEDELFGHVRGAFTGASHDRPGAFASASGGTLFLDEVGELPLELQPKLLRALESREVYRLGSGEPTRVDVRVIAATHRDLRAAVNAGTFRSDLYYRLAVVDIRLPPLRERRGDLPLLVETLLRELGGAPGAIAQQLLSAELLDGLERHPWSGNVRELRNWIERFVALQEPPPLAPPTQGEWTVDVREPLRTARDRFVRAFERRYLEEILRAHGGNLSEAARAAGVDRVHFYRLMARSGVRRS